MIPYAARRGTAELPLHGGKAPAWLFQRMVAMADCTTPTSPTCAMRSNKRSAGVPTGSRLCAA